jgi:hypothetical protein
MSEKQQNERAARIEQCSAKMSDPILGLVRCVRVAEHVGPHRGGSAEFNAPWMDDDSRNIDAPTPPTRNERQARP